MAGRSMSAAAFETVGKPTPTARSRHTHVQKLLTVWKVQGGKRLTVLEVPAGMLGHDLLTIVPVSIAVFIALVIVFIAAVVAVIRRILVGVVPIILVSTLEVAEMALGVMVII